MQELDRFDLADLCTVELDPGLGVHHQAGTIESVSGNGFGEASAEQCDGKCDDGRNRQHAERTCDCTLRLTDALPIR